MLCCDGDAIVDVAQEAGGVTVTVPSLSELHSLQSLGQLSPSLSRLEKSKDTDIVYCVYTKQGWGSQDRQTRNTKSGEFGFSPLYTYTQFIHTTPSNYNHVYIITIKSSDINKKTDVRVWYINPPKKPPAHHGTYQKRGYKCRNGHMCVES